MGLVYYKKKDGEEADATTTVSWYDYYRDRVLQKPATEVETQIELPGGEVLTISEDINEQQQHGAD